MTTTTITAATRATGGYDRSGYAKETKPHAIASQNDALLLTACGRSIDRSAAASTWADPLSAHRMIDTGDLCKQCAAKVDDRPLSAVSPMGLRRMACADGADIAAIWREDERRIGTDAYAGLAYWWNYSYRIPMRDVTHTERSAIHHAILAAGLALQGESAAHAQIIGDNHDRDRIAAMYGRIVSQ